MGMKLTPYQQEMLDGKHGETKKFCMEKLVDFGEAVEAEEMVDLVLVLNECPIKVDNRRAPGMMEKLAEYDLGHSALYDPIFAMKDAHVADESGCRCGNDPYMAQLDKMHEKGYPWNFEQQAACPNTARTSTRIARQSASSSWTTRSATT